MDNTNYCTKNPIQNIDFTEINQQVDWMRNNIECEVFKNKPLIHFKEPYYSFINDVLVKDKLIEGINSDTSYDVLDTDGEAYVLSLGDNEVRVFNVEDKKINTSLFNIASFPMIKVEDGKFINGLSEHAKAEAEWAINKLKDKKLIELMRTALELHSKDKNHTKTPNHIVDVHYGERVKQAHLYSAINCIKQHELTPRIILCNPVNTDEMHFLVRKTKDLSYVRESVMIPEEYIFIVAESRYIGVNPTFGLSVVHNPKPEIFKEGWVCSEMLGMIIMNPSGLALIHKLPEKKGKNG